MATPVALDRSVPFVAAVLAHLEQGAPLEAVRDALRAAEAAHGLTVVHEEGVAPGDGVFVPREGGPVPLGRLREIARSWERFDRAFAPEEPGSVDARIRRQLWPFLDDTWLLVGGTDFAPDHLVVFEDGAVGSWSAASWGRVLAGWARARRWGGRDDWHPDHFAASLAGLVPGYGPWRAAVLEALDR